jgi:hypothetical protein
MKNKKAVYILLPAVILVWSAIIYQFYEGGDDEPAYQYQKKAAGEGPAAAPEKKEYSLYLNYPDPFRAAVAAEQVAVKRENQTPQVEVRQATESQPPEVISFDWNRLSYKGMVEHGGKKNKIALLEMDGKNYMLGQGSRQDELLVGTVTKDSVEVKIGKESAYIRKK